MGGIWLQTNFAAENRVVTLRCGDHTVSKETCFVAYHLTGVWRTTFRCCGNFFAWFAACTAPQCTTCGHSCWNATNPKYNKSCGFGKNAHVTAHLIGYHSLWPLLWRHNGHDGVSNDQPHDCLLSHLFRRWSKKISKLRVIGLCGGIHRWPVNSPHKWQVKQKMFPFDDVIIRYNRDYISMVLVSLPFD